MSESKRTDERISLEMRERALLKILEIDIETFILFARRFMDLVAKLIEKQIVRPDGSMSDEDGFTEHKAYFIKNRTINPTYTTFLEDKTYWYEQELTMYRNKIYLSLRSLPNREISLSEVRRLLH